MADVGVLVRQLQTLISGGVGVPVAAPQAPRALFVREDGALGSILYVWDGSSWTAVA